MLKKSRTFMRTVPAPVWGWWFSGTVIAMMLPCMPDSPARDLMTIAATVVITMGIRCVYFAPGPEGE